MPSTVKGAVDRSSSVRELDGAAGEDTAPHEETVLLEGLDHLCEARVAVEAVGDAVGDAQDLLERIAVLLCERAKRPQEILRASLRHRILGQALEDPHELFVILQEEP